MKLIALDKQVGQTWPGTKQGRLFLLLSNFFRHINVCSLEEISI